MRFSFEPKNKQKYFLIFALTSKMGQIYCIFIGPILRARAEIQKVEMETSKFTYEIN